MYVICIFKYIFDICTYELAKYLIQFPFQINLSAKKSTSTKSHLDYKKPERRNSDSVSAGPHKCRFCPNGFDKTANLKNHVLNHFKDELFKYLPSCTPFLCPECKAPSRDKITCLRHYAFNHKKAFEFCPEDDFKPRVSGHPIKDIPKGGKPYQGTLSRFKM